MSPLPEIAPEFSAIALSLLMTASEDSGRVRDSWCASRECTVKRKKKERRGKATPVTGCRSGSVDRVGRDSLGPKFFPRRPGQSLGASWMM